MQVHENQYHLFNAVFSEARKLAGRCAWHCTSLLVDVVSAGQGCFRWLETSQRVTMAPLHVLLLRALQDIPGCFSFLHLQQL